jgi:hypothetical protein
MANLKFLSSSYGGTRRQSHGQQQMGNALMAANVQALAVIGMPACNDCQDVRGQNLRALRLQQNFNPALLATLACISLRQLYQLESGGVTLFYSSGLRDQAGRRVAALLGAQWHDLSNPALG